MTTEIVLAHSVSEKAKHPVGPRQKYAVTPKELEEYLSRRQGWTSLPYDEIDSRERSGNAFVLTFDDAFEDISRNVLPIVDEFQVPFILFVPVEYVDGQRVPFEFRLAGCINASHEIKLPGGERWELTVVEEKRQLYQELWKRWKKESSEDRRNFLQDFLRTNPHSQRTEARFLNWDQLRDLASHPLCSIGSHTLSHPHLPSENLRSIWRELRESRRILEEQLPVAEVDAISYPYGAHDSFSRIIARMAGYRYGFSTRKEHFTEETLMEIPRLDLSDGLIDG